MRGRSVKRTYRYPGWTTALLLGAMTFVAGCPPVPADSVRVRVELPQPLPDGPIEAVVRAVPSVTDVQVHQPGQSYTMSFKRIPGRNSVSFRSPELGGAWGWVGQSVHSDRTTTDLTAAAEWPRGSEKPG